MKRLVIILMLIPNIYLFPVEICRDIIRPGQELVGSPYRYGASGPSLFDCSGLVSYLYKAFVPALPRVSRQMAGFGNPVGRSDLLPGDLVFFATGSSGSSITHVAVYIGQDSLLHAISNGPERGVAITPLSARYWSRRYAGAVRVLESASREPVIKRVEKMRFAKGLYTGRTVNGEPEGEGVLEMDNGDRYEGAFKAGLFHGEGRYTWAGGRSRSGIFSEGSFPETEREGSNYLLEKSSPWESWDGVVEGDFRLWLEEEQRAFEEWKKTH